MGREQEELVLRLYRDPKLVLAVLAEAKLPDGATRVALAIGPGEEPPHILVERDGRFITCLGEGMVVREALAGWYVMVRSCATAGRARTSAYR